MSHIKQQLLESYNKNAKLRDRTEIERWKIDEMLLFHSVLPQTGTVRLLDLGAGPGHQGKFFSDLGLRVTCADLSPQMVASCREKGLEAFVNDFYSLEFADGTFDAVWAMNSLLHVPKADLSIVLNNVKRVLKPNGTFYMGLYGGYDQEGIWQEDTYEPKRFFAFYTNDSIREKVGESFDIVRFEVVPIEGAGPDYQSIICRPNSRD